MADEVYEHLTFDDIEHVPIATLPGMWRADGHHRLGRQDASASRAGRSAGRRARPPLVERGAHGQAVPHLRGQRPVPVRGRRSGSACPTPTSPSSAPTSQRKRDLLCGRSGAGRPGGVPPAGHVLRHRRHPLDRRGRRPGLLPRRCPSGAGWWRCPNVVFYDDVDAGRPLVRFAFCKRHEVLEEAVDRLTACEREAERAMKIAAIQHDIAWEDGAATRRHLEPHRRAARRPRAPAWCVLTRDVRHRLLAGRRPHRRAGGRADLDVDAASRPPPTACGSTARCAERPADGRPASQRRRPGRAGRHGPPLRQDPPVHLRRRARGLRRRRPATLTVDVDGLRISLFVCYDLRFADDWWPLAPTTDLYLCCANWPEARRAPLAGAAAGSGHREPGLRGGRQPRRRGRWPDLRRATAASSIRWARCWPAPPGTETVLLADVDAGRGGQGARPLPLPAGPPHRHARPPTGARTGSRWARLRCPDDRGPGGDHRQRLAGAHRGRSARWPRATSSSSWSP